MKTTTLASLAKLTNAKLIGDEDYLIEQVADLGSATERDASFLANDRYTPLLKKTKAGVVCISEGVELIDGKNYLVCDDPSRAFQQIAQHLLDVDRRSGFDLIHPSAVIHPQAHIGKDVRIGPCVVIEKGAHIGDRSCIFAQTYIGVGAQIGQDCTLYPHVTIREHCSIGSRVILQPGAVIGSCGFGYITDAKGEHTKLEQLGNVILEDDVEIGANTTIDRARFKTTRIKRGTKIDNLVQIAHNVELGEHNILASQTGLAGSTKTGRNVFMGGQVGVVGHLEITDFVMIATRGGVSKSIPKSGKYAGSPVGPLSEDNRNQVYLRKISLYVKRIEALEKKLEQLSALPTN